MPAAGQVAMLAIFCPGIVEVTGGMEAGNRRAATLIGEESIGQFARAGHEQIIGDLERWGIAGGVIYDSLYHVAAGLFEG